MRCFKFGLRSSIFLIAFMFILKMDSIESFDDHAKRHFPSILLNAYPNPKPNYNTLFAPFALRRIILTTSLFAKRETKTEIEQLLQGLRPDDVPAQINEFKDKDGWKVQLYVNRKTDVSPCVKKLAYGFIKYIDYSQSDAATRIDNWIANRTKNIIPQMHLPLFKEDTSFATLVHVEYLDAVWQKPFENTTRVEGLTNDVLHQNNEFLYGNLSDLNAQVLELPLNNNARMVVLHPYNQDFKANFMDLKEKLKKTDIRNLTSRLQKTKLSLHFPRLNAVKCVREVTAAANNLGVKRAFTTNADFTRLHQCADDSYIKSVNQHARISTDYKTLRIGAQTDIRFNFATTFKPSLISGESEADEMEPETYTTKVILKQDGYQDFFVRRFMYAIIKDDTVLFMGTVVKDHNVEEAKRLKK